MSYQPAPRDLHIDTFLTNVSIGYTNLEYIADIIFPIVPVNKQSDLIPNYNQSPWFRDDAQLRAPGTKSQRSGWTVGNSNYFCPRFSFGHEIPDEVRDNADAPWNLDVESVEYVTDKLQMRRERSFASTLMTTGKWTGQADQVGGTNFVQYSDYGNSTPLVDFTADMDAVEGSIGRGPNTLVIGKQVWSQLKWHPDLIDTIKYTQRAQLTVDLVASLLEIERILVGKAIYTASPEGTAEASVSYQRIWGKSGLFLWVPPAPSLMAPAAGYTFVWNRVSGAQQYIKRIRDEEREVDIIEGNSYFAQTQTASRAGAFLSQMVA